MPSLNGLAVMDGDVFDRVDLELDFLHVLLHGRSTKARIGPWEDELVHEKAPNQIFGSHRTSQASPLKEEDPLISQHVMTLLIEGFEVFNAYVFDHLKTDDLVVFGHWDLSVIHTKYAAAISSPVFFDLLSSIGSLVYGESDACSIDTVMLGRVTGKCSPPASDIEEAIARLQLKLLANEVQLIVLSILKSLAVLAIEAGGIDHSRPKEPAEEIITTIVVFADNALILRLGVNRDLRKEVRNDPLQVIGR